MDTTVMVVDDMELVRSGIIALLDLQPDLRVVASAGSGAKAIELARQHRPDVVLMDVQMPGMDGVAAAKQVLADSHQRSAVIMLTTFDDDEFVYAALRAGASGFLLKDTPADDLVKAVRLVARGEALLAPTVTKRLIQKFAHGSCALDAMPKLKGLTDRERTVLVLVAKGLSNNDIAQHLILSESTVKTHLNRTMAKLGISTRAQLVTLAYESGLAVPWRGEVAEP